MPRDKHKSHATHRSNSNSSSSSSCNNSSSSSSCNSSSNASSRAASLTDDRSASPMRTESPLQRAALAFGPKADGGRAFGLERAHNGDKMATREASLVAVHDEPEPEHAMALMLPEQHVHSLSSSAVSGTAPRALAHGVHTPVIKRRNVGVPKFLRFLFQILEEEDPRVITWSHDGTAFQIKQPDDLATQVLPKYFKHNKVSSFQRQLNYFGFKKWTKTQTNVCTFSHPCFVRADKDKMKLIKRKERAHAAGLGMSVSGTPSAIDSESMDEAKTSYVHDFAPAPSALAPFEAYDLAGCPPSQLPTQQALKRQKSTTLSGATVSFLNSGAAGRRHSTGMLPGSEAFGLAAAAAAAAASGASPSAIADSFVLGRKRVGTPAEQEFELEMEARSNAVTNSPIGPQLSMYMRKIAENKELSQHYTFPPAQGKRQSLPHVLAPGFGNSFGIGMNNNVPGMEGVGSNSGFGAHSANILSRRRSGQAQADHGNVNGVMGNRLSRFDNSMLSSSRTAFQQTAVLPISSGLAHNVDLQQQQQWQHVGQQLQSGRVTGYGAKAHSGTEWPASYKSGSSIGWPASMNSNAGSVGSTPYQTQSQTRPMPLSFLPRGSSAPSGVNPSLHASESMDHVHIASAEDRKMQIRPLASQVHEVPFHQDRVTSYPPQEDQHDKKDLQPTTQQPRDYIDVLLENAGLDDGLTSQSSTMLSSELWSGHSESDARCLGSTGSFAFMQPQQTGLQPLQLSPMGEMCNNAGQRF